MHLLHVDPSVARSARGDSCPVEFERATAGRFSPVDVNMEQDASLGFLLPEADWQRSTLIALREAEALGHCGRAEGFRVELFTAFEPFLSALAAAVWAAHGHAGGEERCNEISAAGKEAFFRALSTWAPETAAATGATFGHYLSRWVKFGCQETARSTLNRHTVATIPRRVLRDLASLAAVARSTTDRVAAIGALRDLNGWSSEKLGRLLQLSDRSRSRDVPLGGEDSATSGGGAFIENEAVRYRAEIKDAADWISERMIKHLTERQLYIFALTKYGPLQERLAGLFVLNPLNLARVTLTDAYDRFGQRAHDGELTAAEVASLLGITADVVRHERQDVRRTMQRISQCHTNSREDFASF